MPHQLVPYWNALKRWWWLVVVSMTLAGASAYMYWRNQPPVYQARIALIVGNAARSANPDPQQLGIERTLATFYGEMAKRQPVTQAVIQRLSLELSPEELGAAIETRVVFDAQILEIYVYDVDPQRAALLATSIAEELIRQSPASASRQGNTQEFTLAQIADLEQKIKGIDQELTDLRNRMTQMTSASDLAEARAKASELEKLRLDYTTAYTQYLNVLNNQTVNSLSIVEPASLPTRPVSTGIVTTLLIALAGGLVLSIGAIVLLEYTDTMLHWNDVFVENAPPVLGIVPALPRRRNPLIIKSQPDSAEADAVRSLRTRIFMADTGAMIKRLLITSPTPRDGKTFTAVNLALAAADAGLRVILVDGDIRAGTVHNYFGLEREPGLTNILWHGTTDAAQLLSLLRRTPISNLKVLTAGTLARDPLVLLRSPHLRQLMDMLSERADLIIIDSPPVAAGPITTLLSGVADGIVIVASIDRTNRKLFEASRQELTKHAESPLLGLALNRVALHKLTPEVALYGYGYNQSQTLHRAPIGLIGRLLALPAILIGKVTRRPALSANGHGGHHSAAQWLEEMSTDLESGEAAAPSEPAEASESPVPTPPKLDSMIMTVTEAAAQLEESEETIEEWCRAGALPSVRIGKRWLVTGLMPQEKPEVETGESAYARE